MGAYKWNDSFYLRVYELACEGRSQDEIAGMLGVTALTLRKWRNERPALEEAFTRASRASVAKDQPLSEYIHAHLPEELQDLWEELNAAHYSGDARMVIDRIRMDNGREAHQRLFIHALTTNSYNLTHAMRICGVSRARLDSWAADPQFTELIREIEWHRDNFFENEFMRLVRAGNPAAVLHAARTRLRNRGYGDSVAVSVSGTVEHTHRVDLDDIELPIEVRREILAAIRDQMPNKVEDGIKFIGSAG